MYNQAVRSITKGQIHSHGDFTNHWVNLLKIAPGWRWTLTLYSFDFQVLDSFLLTDSIHSLITSVYKFLLLSVMSSSFCTRFKQCLGILPKMNSNCQTPGLHEAKSSWWSGVCCLASLQLFTAEQFHRDERPAPFKISCWIPWQVSPTFWCRVLLWNLSQTKMA